MRNYFPKQPSGAPLHTLSKLYDVPVGFEPPPPLFWGWILLILRSPKGGCFSISDDLSCSFQGIHWYREYMYVIMPLNGQHWTSPASSDGRASDLKTQGCGFESQCGQKIFILYFVASDALLEGRLVQSKWNQAWRPSKVYRYIERER